MKLRILFILLLIILAGCGNDTMPEDSSTGEQEASVAVSFRNLDMEVENLSFTLTGEVRTDEQQIYYHVMQGDEILLAEEEIEIEADTGWVQFEISETLPPEAEDEDVSPIVTLFGKTAGGEEANPNYIPVDIGIR